MKAGIISAGEGFRLKRDGIQTPKPLVEVGGVPLIDRLLAAFAENGITEIICIVNEAGSAVQHHVSALSLSVPVHFLRKTTESSMHSLFELSPFLSEAPFLLTTVDSVFDPLEFRRFVLHCQRSKEVDGILAVTKFVQDENPLWAEVDDDDRIVRLGRNLPSALSVTGGIYYFSPSVFRQKELALRRGVSRLRNYLSLLVESGYRFNAYPFSKIVDVDHAKDIVTADHLVKSVKTLHS